MIGIADIMIDRHSRGVGSWHNKSYCRGTFPGHKKYRNCCWCRWYRQYCTPDIFLRSCWHTYQLDMRCNRHCQAADIRICRLCSCMAAGSHTYYTVRHRLRICPGCRSRAECKWIRSYQCPRTEIRCRRYRRLGCHCMSGREECRRDSWWQPGWCCQDRMCSHSSHCRAGCLTGILCTPTD